ncbi:MAG TPA: threonine ammonia-lyase [Hyphomicrobiaceae bacterium]|nr:threonine ammonia-lyase [Hyphomicrobiaceae bacterium]
MPPAISVALDDIERARAAIRKHTSLSPCIRSHALSARCDCGLHLKMENLQRTGAYKDRGAMNAVLGLDDTHRAAGVIAASAGNHAQGLAYAAQRNGIEATIVMPETAPMAKRRGTERYGANVILHGSGYDDAFLRATELQAERGYAFVHAFDDPCVIAGQGTIGLELLEQRPDLEVAVVPIGGGGLAAGLAIALKQVNPKVRIIGVQAESLASMKASVDAGRIVTVSGTTIADGIAVAQPGRHTFPIVQKYVDEIVTVSEEEIASAILVLLESEKTVVEGAGAAGVAAVLHGKIAGISGRQVCCVLTGGNIDTTFLWTILQRGLAKDGRLAKISVIVPDRPASIVDLAAIAASQHANILDIHHGRTFTSAAFRETEIELMVETRGPETIEALLQAVAARGYQARSFSFE